MILFILFFTLEVKAQIFIPFSFWRCDYSQETITENTGPGFSAGTFASTAVSGDTVTLSAGQTTGTYTSKVYDSFRGCMPLLLYHYFEWKTPSPYNKEVPTTNEVAADYSAITTALNTNLELYFRMNGTGTIANGAAVTATAGPNATAANTNGAGLTYTNTAVLRNAITFDGTDDHINIPYTQTSVSQYTIATWFRTTTAANGVFVQNRGGGAGQSLTLAIGNNPGGCAAGRISFGIDSNAIYIGKCTNTTYNDGNWHHAVGVFNGTSGSAVTAGQFTIYIDGQAVTQSNTTIGSLNAPLTGEGNTLLGRHDAWSVNYNGSLDELMVWSRALSATEVQQL